jgi:hypothetical protein
MFTREQEGRKWATEVAGGNTGYWGAGPKLWRRRRGAARKPAVSLAAAVEDESKWSGMAARLSAGRRRTEGKRGKTGEGAARTGKEWMPLQGSEPLSGKSKCVSLNESSFFLRSRGSTLASTRACASPSLAHPASTAILRIRSVPVADG